MCRSLPFLLLLNLYIYKGTAWTEPSHSPFLALENLLLSMQPSICKSRRRALRAKTFGGHGPSYVVHKQPPGLYSLHGKSTLFLRGFPLGCRLAADCRDPSCVRLRGVFCG
uniref:Putative secreted protein n=1 Tax=Ixodes ricinus TaxID=34613 RepID=A0A147BFW0_IXORI